MRQPQKHTVPWILRSHCNPKSLWIYVVAGWWRTGGAFIDVYNPRSDTWRSSLSPPGSNLIGVYGGQAAAALDGKIYIVGGWNTNDGRVHIYDPESDTLTQGPDVKVKTRYYLAAIYHLR